MERLCIGRQQAGKSNEGALAQCEAEAFPTEEEGYDALRPLLAATGVVGLTARAILAQSNPPGPAASTQDEPIKRTVLFRGDLEGAPDKEIVVFVADLAPGAVGSKHYHPGPEFFSCSKVRWPTSRKVARRT
jgi:hypothetical protein